MIGSYERLLSFGNQVGLSDGLWIFIVHIDELGQERTFQGIRHNPNPPDNMAMAYYTYREHDITVPPEKSPWELLYVNSHEGFDPSLVTRNNKRIYGSVVLEEGEETCLRYACFQAITDLLNRANLSYWPHDQNSNGVAYTIKAVRGTNSSARTGGLYRMGH